MRPGSVRILVVPAGAAASEGGEGAEAGPEVVGPVALVPEGSGRSGWAGAVRRYRVEALAPGQARIRVAQAQWQIDVRGPARPTEQTRDDTDEGWGDAQRGHSSTWWEEQRPPHW